MARGAECVRTGETTLEGAADPAGAPSGGVRPVVRASLRLAPVLVACVLASPAGAAERLRVTESGRYLERADGAPFFYLGDTAWLLLQRLDSAETERYLADRAEKG